MSYTEFMKMPYRDFKRIEATFIFKNKQINSKSKQQSNDKVKANLSNVPARNVRDLGFSDEQLKGIFGDKF